MRKPTKIVVSGPFACFTRPECKAEKMSYEAMTPSAAANILQSIYWKPEFQWKILEIHVLKPIRYISMMLNEIGTKKPILNVAEGKNRQQTRNLFLRDVSYGIVAEIVPTKPELEEWIKHHEVFQRRAGKGQSFTSPYLGLREFLAEWTLGEIPATEIPDSESTKPLGPMLREFNYIKDPHGTVIPKRTKEGVNLSGAKYRVEPVFFNAVMDNGVIVVNR